MEQLHAEELAYYRDAAMEADKKRKEMEQLMGSLRLELNAEREARLLCMEELERMRARLVDADRELAELRPVLAQRDELLQKWENFTTYTNEPLVRELQAARSLVDNQRQWMRCFLELHHREQQ